MIKKQLIIITVLLSSLIPSFGQGNNNEETFIQEEVPKEQVFLHLNSSLFFSGEKLLYKFYSLEGNTNTLSNLSKIGWVDLVDSNKKIIYQHKIKLEEGKGFADFFIPSSLPSGAYKIVAYTRWMLNAKNNYFQQDIHILNPYQDNEEDIDIVENIESKNIISNIGEDRLEIHLNKNSFSYREEVILNLENKDKLKGDFSISVRRVDRINKPEKLKSTNFLPLYEDVRWDFSDTLIYPEIRGAFFRGKIESEEILSFSDKNVIISFPGEKDQVKVVSTNKEGDFSFILNNAFSGDEAVLQILDEKNANYAISLREFSKPDYNELSFETPKLTQEYKKYILEKSINNQIENAYSASKFDRLTELKDNNYFFDEKLIHYNLDDYNRFSDMYQTFTEIIKFGRIRKNDQGKEILLVRSKNPRMEFDNPALLIVDGVMVQNHEILVSYDPYKIKSIDVLRDKLFYGPEVFQGAIVVETQEGNFPTEFRQDYHRFKPIKAAQRTKQYYNPDYQTKDLERIPDYRYQLLWKPEVKLDSDENEVKFYTSDLNGKFEINLEGFTNEGTPISISKTFSVE